MSQCRFRRDAVTNRHSSKLRIIYLSFIKQYRNIDAETIDCIQIFMLLRHDTIRLRHVTSISVIYAPQQRLHGSDRNRDNWKT